MLVSPVPSKDSLALQKRRKLGNEFRPLRVEQREGLMMREQEQSAAICLRHQRLEPRVLTTMQVVLIIGCIETRQNPVVILKRKVARGLAELPRDGFEIGIAARVHF